MKTFSRPHLHFWFLAIAALWGWGTIGVSVHAQAKPSVYGLELVPYAKQMEENRFSSDRDYKNVITFFEKKFRGKRHIQWLPEVSLVGIKYTHIRNTDPRSDWEGLNIYTMPSGQTRLFVLKRK